MVYPLALRKAEVVASRGVVTSNHPLASNAGVEMLARGGNAVDAAVATLFALTVVEPMMVSVFGAGFFVIRDGATGTVVTLDNYATCPAAATATMYTPIPDPVEWLAEGDANRIGYKAVGVPGALKGWAEALRRFGRLSLADVMAPAIRFAADGYPASPYLVQSITETAPALARFPASASVFLPDGAPPQPGATIVRSDYAETLRAIAISGPDALYRGPVGELVAVDMAANGGLITMDDLANYQVIERTPVRGAYRGHEIVSMGPVSSGGTHIIEMLNILSGFDLAASGFGTARTIHLMAEALRIAFADWNRYMADPATTDVPVAWLTSMAYADERRTEIDPQRAMPHTAGHYPGMESVNTTHVTTADADGMFVSTTQTLNRLFGSKVTTPGTGMLLNDNMSLMNPTPGTTNSIAGGKRILSCMSPTLVLKDGAPLMALGTPGGRRIFGSVMQGIINVLDHGMTLQEAVEAPRIWTEGPTLEIEDRFPDLAALVASLEAMGHRVQVVPKIAGGMNGVLRDAATGMLRGAACWRADGTPIGISGGPAFMAGPSLPGLA
ncbi:MAG: gamma-glutamyltransferase [Thermomicrobiales bacterium]